MKRMDRIAEAAVDCVDREFFDLSHLFSEQEWRATPSCSSLSSSSSCQILSVRRTHSNQLPCWPLKKNTRRLEDRVGGHEREDACATIGYLWAPWQPPQLTAFLKSSTLLSLTAFTRASHFSFQALSSPFGGLCLPIEV